MGCKRSDLVFTLGRLWRVHRGGGDLGYDSARNVSLNFVLRVNSSVSYNLSVKYKIIFNIVMLS